ncbi:polyphosphate kinase 2 family protein [Alteromonas halophila]|uniref:UDP-galactose-lipid carrier transferase n=1 Tax=Alteromonas halophila TaxID=516698 RepID=A0A918JPI2_9ALTE|nr:polyphosphate kinase [Alteromonas halophila]GGW92953.1 UDP-galactose-lipid carrier transferase [Alteromonas halophila]
MSNNASAFPLRQPPQQLSDDRAHPQIGTKAAYKARLKRGQHTLTHVQQSYYHQQRRALLVIEGWDAAGKGGAIRRITRKLDPRGVHVYPIGRPTPEEQGRHYLYRFNTRLPLPGHWTIFDRSYYGRVLVERIEGFASEQQWQRAYREINEFERQLTDDGVRIVKLFFHISADEQAKRFSERLHNPHKRWKLTEEDLRNRARRDDYERAINDMFAQTDTLACPWHLIQANHKWHARIAAIDTIVSALSEGIDIAPPPIDAQVVALAEAQLDTVFSSD